MDKEEIIEEIRKDYEKMKTLFVNDNKNGDCIDLFGLKYEGNPMNLAANNQKEILRSFSNTVCRFKNLKNANKWFMSACIDIAKKYPSQKFNIKVF